MPGNFILDEIKFNMIKTSNTNINNTDTSHDKIKHIINNCMKLDKFQIQNVID